MSDNLETINSGGWCLNCKTKNIHYSIYGGRYTFYCNTCKRYINNIDVTAHKPKGAIDKKEWARCFKGTPREFIEQAKQQGFTSRRIKYWIKYNWNLEV